MITLVDGVMGSGKSFFIARYIYLNHSNYYKIYTNLDGFKLDSFTNVYLFKQSKFISLMSHCKILYDNENLTDDDIISYLVEQDFLKFDENNKIIPVLLCVDEVHNLLSKSNDLYTFILTYHRHMYMDMIFATQDSTLIYRSYHKLIQKIYRALPADRNIFNIFTGLFIKSNKHINKKNRYQEHLRLPIVDGMKGTFLKNIYYNADSKIYSLYNSGDTVRTKSVYTNFIYSFILLALLATAGFIFFIDHLVDSDNDVNVSVEKVKSDKIINYNSYSNADYSNLTYLKLTCIKDYCESDDNLINLYVDDLNLTLSNTNSKFIDMKVVNNSFVFLRLLVSTKFLQLFKKEKNAVKNTYSIIN